MLLAGEYQFTLNSARASGLITVHSRDLKTSAFVVPVEVAGQNTKAPSALIIQINGNPHAQLRIGKAPQPKSD